MQRNNAHGGGLSSVIAGAGHADEGGWADSKGTLTSNKWCPKKKKKIGKALKKNTDESVVAHSRHTALKLSMPASLGHVCAY